METQRSPHVSPRRLIGSDERAIELARKAIAMVCEGVTLKAALSEVGLTRDMFSSTLSSVRELAHAYARAREISADFLVDEALDVVKNEPDVQRAREIANMHRWAAGKFNQKRYGERIDLNVSQTIDVSEALKEARARIVRPVVDQLPAPQAQVIDLQALPAAEPSDKESRAPLSPPDETGEPDIFS